ncbi:MAG TPA: hypothetical protein DEH02_19190 [Bacteroidales bacterium]|nr:hypothetical protein [Bacteroidales bacterium]
MRQISFFLIFFLLNKITVYGQNLVPNFSFEDYLECPNSAAQFNKVLYWFSPSQGTPDYLNSCCINGSVGIPSNWFGYQQAHSGSAYTVAYIFSSSNQKRREYIQVKLSQTLTFGEKYYIRFYLSITDYSNYAVNNIGAFFSNDSLFLQDDGPFLFVPQYENNISNNLDNKNEWMLLSGNFTASGNENFMTIGCFHDSTTIEKFPIDTNYADVAAYYIDDVYVGLDSTVNINTDVQSKKEEITLYPNPAKERVFIKTANIKPAEMFVYNMQGCLMHQQSFLKNTNIDIKNWPAGVYYVKIISENGIFVRKIVREGL